MGVDIRWVSLSDLGSPPGCKINHIFFWTMALASNDYKKTQKTQMINNCINLMQPFPLHFQSQWAIVLITILSLRLNQHLLACQT